MSIVSPIRRSLGRLVAVWHARNLEFVRDRSSLIFTLGVPVAIVAAMALIFGGPPRALFKVGVLGTSATAGSYPFLAERYFQFVPVADQGAGMHSVARNDLDLLLDLRQRPVRFWGIEDSPKGYVAEKLLLQADPLAQHQPMTGAASRYIDWLFPGVLGMNMMFTLPDGRRLRGRALSQERISQAPVGDAGVGLRVLERPGLEPPGARAWRLP